MGEAFRAGGTKLGREVALKILPAVLAGDPERLARFEREARTLARGAPGERAGGAPSAGL